MRPLRRGTNLSRVAGFNEAVVIDAVRRAPGGLSRVEISEQTGLSAQTVSNIVRRMLEAGLLLERDRIAQGLGKPRTPLVLHPTGRYAIGVHLDPLVTTLVVVNLVGEVAAHQQRPTRADADPGEILAAIADDVPGLLAEAGVSLDQVSGIGFASPGPVDTASGMVLDPPHLPRWRDVRVSDDLGERVGLPVVLDKDVVAAVVGERWRGATLGQANSMFLYLSTGIGVGVAVDDVILRGSTGNAGDIGHMVVDDQGPLCECGRRGCIGVTLSPAALVERAVAAGALGEREVANVHSAEPARVDEGFSALCALVEAGDPTATEVVAASAKQLAKAISTLANIFDTDAVAVGGPTWTRLQAVYLDRLPEYVRPDLVHRPGNRPLSVVGTALGADVIAIGAACLVLDREFAPAVSAIALQR